MMQQPQFMYGSVDGYTHWSQPVSTVGRWASLGQVDQALAAYLHGTRMPRQMQKVIPYKKEIDPLESARNDARETSRQAATARTAALRVSNNMVGDLVDTVGALAETVKRMEDRALLVEERDSARIKAIELAAQLEAQQKKEEQADTQYYTEEKNEKKLNQQQQQQEAQVSTTTASTTPVAPSLGSLMPEAWTSIQETQNRMMKAVMEQSTSLVEQQAKLAGSRQLVSVDETRTELTRLSLAYEQLANRVYRRRQGRRQDEDYEESSNSSPGSTAASVSADQRRRRSAAGRRAKAENDENELISRAVRAEAEVDALRRELRARDEARLKELQSSLEQAQIELAKRREMDADRIEAERIRLQDLSNDIDISRRQLLAHQDNILLQKGEQQHSSASTKQTQEKAATVDINNEALVQAIVAERVARETARLRTETESKLDQWRREQQQRERDREAELEAKRLDIELKREDEARKLREAVQAESARRRDQEEALEAAQREARQTRDLLEAKLQALADQQQRQDRQAQVKPEVIMTNHVNQEDKPELEKKIVTRIQSLLSEHREAQAAEQQSLREEITTALSRQTEVEMKDAGHLTPPKIESTLKAPMTTTPSSDQADQDEVPMFRTLSSEADPDLFAVQTEIATQDNHIAPETAFVTTTEQQTSPRPEEASPLREITDRSSLEAEPEKPYSSSPRPSPTRTSRPPTTPAEHPVLGTPRWSKGERSVRAVKVTFGTEDVAPESDILNVLEEYGHVVKLGRRQTAAIALFSDATAAARAAREYAGPWRVERVVDALGRSPSPKKRSTFFQGPSAPFSVLETSSRSFEHRTLDVLWGGPELAPRTDDDFKKHFSFFGAIVRTFRHRERGMIMFANADDCDRCLSEYRGPWKLAKLSLPSTGIDPVSTGELASPQVPPAVTAVAMRSVRCAFPETDNVSEEDIRMVMNAFGTVLKVKRGDSSGVVLFSSAEEAERAVRDYRGDWLVDRGISLLPPSPNVPPQRNQANQRASVRVAWAAAAPPPSELQLRQVMTRFGQVDRLAVGQRSALVLFSTEEDAVIAVRDYSGPWRLRRGDSSTISPLPRAMSSTQQTASFSTVRLDSDRSIDRQAEPPLNSTLESKQDEEEDFDHQDALPQDEAIPAQEDESIPDQKDETLSAEIAKEDNNHADSVDPIEEKVSETLARTFESEAPLDRSSPTVDDLDQASEEDIALRCVKVSWRKRPAGEDAFRAHLAKLDVQYVLARMRAKSAVVMFATSAEATRAVKAINLGSTKGYTATLTKSAATPQLEEKPSIERLANRNHIESILQEPAVSPDSESSPLSQRCIIISWSKQTRPRDDATFAALLASMDIVPVSSKLRTNSAIVMFADNSEARQAVQVFKRFRESDAKLDIGGQDAKKPAKWSVAIIADALSPSTPSNNTPTAAPF